MLLMVLRKMLNNKWMVACLLLGTILATAVISAIPMYTTGITQRMLVRDMQQTQQTTGHFPGYMFINTNFRFANDVAEYGKNYLSIKNQMDQTISSIGVKLISQSHHATLENCTGTILPKKPNDFNQKSLTMESLSGMEKQVKMLAGRLPNNQIIVKDFNDGMEDIKKARFIEVAITANCQDARNIDVGDVLQVYTRSAMSSDIFYIKVVGIFEPVDHRDAYWYFTGDDMRQSVFANYEAFDKMFLRVNEQSMMVGAHTFMYAFDYQHMTAQGMKQMQSAFAKFHDLTDRSPYFTYTAEMEQTLEKYTKRQNQLQMSLLVLEVPLLLMLAFYIFMVSQLIIDFEKNEISVLKSRGANNRQITTLYLLQSLIIAVVALIIGPMIGAFICNMIGASNGFLSFVSRTGIGIVIDSSVFIFSGIALLFSILMMLLPALLQARSSIVEHKQRKARGGKAPLWKRGYFDLIALAGSVYGIFYYQGQNEIFSKMTLEQASNTPMEPLLYGLSMLFIVGAGLFLLRLYPLLIQFIFFLGKKNWKAVPYATFVQVGRSMGKEQFLMLFLIMTVAMGLFSANAARTINFNQEARIKYNTGADLVLTSTWETGKMFSGTLDSDLYTDENGDLKIREDADTLGKEVTVYIEPPYISYANLKGVDHATKVFLPQNPKLQRGGLGGGTPVKMMGVEPYNFGKVAYPPPLQQSKYHWNYYLNALTQMPEGILLSNSFKDRYGVKLNQEINFSWGENKSVRFIIIGFIDSWPTLDPMPPVQTDTSPDAVKPQEPLIAVGNIDYMFASTNVAPYQVWIKRDLKTPTSVLYTDMKKKQLPVINIVNGLEEIVRLKNDAMLQGTNGAMTLCFIMTLAVSIVGFIIYWVLSIRSRVLQFGIFLSMGMKMRNVLRMLGLEQFLISGIAVFIGICIGVVSSMLYVPLMQFVYNVARQMPHFRVVSNMSDYVKIFLFISGMLAIGIVLLVRIVSRIKITQAIKLGED